VTAADFTVRWAGRHVVATMPAEIDVTNSASVDSVLAGVAAQHPDLITADMTSTVFCDSSGIHALARAHDRPGPGAGRLPRRE
jgi:anti-anti-sigma regulatory factor